VSKPRVYLETSVLSYLTSRPSRDIVIAANQQVTREWWNNRRHLYDIFISQFVLDEAAAGDPTAARERLKSIEHLQQVELIPEAARLATAILSSGRFPASAASDAVHIALAAAHRMDFLLTCNCSHIANAMNARFIEALCRRNELESPIICTPHELMEG
jgi:predicted nucleic acid-binding protein